MHWKELYQRPACRHICVILSVGVASGEHATGILTGKGDDYSYDIKAQFEDAHSAGTRNKGLGIEGRTCTLEFVKR